MVIDCAGEYLLFFLTIFVAVALGIVAALYLIYLLFGVLPDWLADQRTRWRLRLRKRL